LITPFSHRNPTHAESLLKFLGLAGILVGYFAVMSWKYDAASGAGLSALSWSFFVLCTPIADGGFVLAFPVRLLFSVKMAVTQAALWFVAIGLNVALLHWKPGLYELTFLTRLLKTILTQPWPYWGILAISAVGTGLSIWFGDEMMDVTRHQQREIHHRHGFKYRILVVFGLGALTVLAYYQLLDSLGVRLPG